MHISRRHDTKVQKHKKYSFRFCLLLLLFLIEGQPHDFRISEDRNSKRGKKQEKRKECQTTDTFPKLVLMFKSLHMEYYLLADMVKQHQQYLFMLSV